MTSPPRRALVPVLVLLGLLGAAHVEHGLARLGVLWRQSVLSWDNPATQVLEELASQGVPHADGARQARDRGAPGRRDGARLRGAAGPRGGGGPRAGAGVAAGRGDGARLGVAGDPDGLPDAASCPCVSRAPPVA